MVDCSVSQVGRNQPVVAYDWRLISFLIESIVVLSLPNYAQTLNGAYIHGLAYVEPLRKPTVISVK